MAKQLVSLYTFDPVAKTVTLLGIPNINLEQILLVTNVTDGIILYSFADSACSGTLVDNVLTLTYDTTAMESTDRLQIFIDMPVVENIESEQQGIDESYVIDTNLSEVLGTQSLVDKGSLKTNTVFSQSKVSGRIGSTNETLGIDCNNMNTVAIQLSGIWAGTVSWEARVDTGNYVAVQALNSAGANLGSTTTTPTILRINCAGLTRVQVRFSAYTSGTALVTMVASGAKVDVPGATTVLGNQTTIQQRATTYEANTWDTNLSTVLGNVSLWRPGFTAVDPVVAPTVNPTQPSTYAATRYSQYPQYFNRLRVESGGSQKLPFAQAQNSRMLVEQPELLSITEQILIELRMLNWNFATANGLSTQGLTEIK